MYCMKCGTQMPDEMRYCPKCGSEVYSEENKKEEKPIAKKIDNTWTCSDCNTKNNLSNECCKVCGASRNKQVSNLDRSRHGRKYESYDSNDRFVRIFKTVAYSLTFIFFLGLIIAVLTGIFSGDFSGGEIKIKF